MKKIKTNFKDLFLIKGITHYDNRGFFRELVYQKIIPKKLVFTVISKSKKNILRGLHFQTKKPQGKLLCVLKGKISDVALDLRKNSKTYLKVFKCILSDKNNTFLYIPPGFAHGFFCIDRDNYVIYSCSKYRHKQSEVGIKYNDPHLSIKWPSKKLIISNKDKNNISLKSFLNKYIK